MEAEKTRRAYSIASQCGLFRVPRVLDYNHDKGELTLERIPRLVKLCNMKKRSRIYKAAVERSGRALAVIHRNMFLPPPMIQPLPDVFDWFGTEAFVHGDFDTQNVCVQEGTSMPVILDWQMSPRYREKGTYGCRYYDLVWFIEGLLWPDNAYLLGDPVTPLVEGFLGSYISESGNAGELQKFAAYVNRIFTWKGVLRRDYLGERRFLNRRRRMLTERCMKRIEQMSVAWNGERHETPTES